MFSKDYDFQDYFIGEIQSKGKTASQFTLASGAEWTHGITIYSNILFFIQVRFT